MNPVKDTPSELVDQLGPFLEAREFGRHTRSRYEGKFKHTWTHQNGNILHRVTCVYAVRHPTDISMGLSVDVIVGEDTMVVAGTPLAKLHRNDVFYHMPVFFKSLRASRFIRTIISDLDKSLDWFRPFTRERCLEMVLSGEAYIGRHATLFNDLVVSLGGQVDKTDEKAGANKAL